MVLLNNLLTFFYQGQCYPIAKGEVHLNQNMVLVILICQTPLESLLFCLQQFVSSPDIWLNIKDKNCLL